MKRTGYGVGIEKVVAMVTKELRKTRRPTAKPAGKTKQKQSRVVRLPSCSPEFYETTAVIPTNITRLAKPIAGYGHTIDEALANLRAQGYSGSYQHIWVGDPRKNYHFAGL